MTTPTTSPEAAIDRLDCLQDHATTAEGAAALLEWLGMAARNADLPGADRPSAAVTDPALWFIAGTLRRMSGEVLAAHGDVLKMLNTMRKGAGR